MPQSENLAGKVWLARAGNLTAIFPGKALLGVCLCYSCKINYVRGWVDGGRGSKTIYGVDFRSYSMNALNN
jgi:hypothetical protein